MANDVLLNTTTDLNGKTLVTAEGDRSITGLLTYSRGASAPFAVAAGAANVTNLDADKLDGNDSTAFQLAASAFAMPTGALVMYAAAAAPSGWQLCDGSSLLRASFPALFAVIGTAYGAADGTHFTVPDLRQKFPMGVAASGTGNTLGATGGAIDHTHTYTQVPNHVHTITDPTHVHNILQSTGTAGGLAGFDVTVTTARTDGVTGFIDAASTGITGTNNPTGGVATGTTAAQNPPFVTVNYIIKT